MSGKRFTLYWSSLETYESCPQRFLWSRGWGTIDVGGGVGRSKPEPVKKSRHSAVMGIVIQRVVEDLYNLELWKYPVGLLKRLDEMVEKEFHYEISRNFIDWRFSPSKTELLQVCKAGVFGFLQTMKANKLLGQYAKAEVDLIGWIDKYNPVGGRADLIIRRDDDGVMILDGKNSQQKGKYTNPDQLRWYAMCYYLCYSQIPDKLGFIYYRFPYDSEKGESGVDWVTFTKEDLQGLARRAVDARKGMDKEKFLPTPSPSVCKFCDYETVCDARQGQKKENARRPRNEMDVLDGADGFVDFGFNSSKKN